MNAKYRGLIVAITTILCLSVTPLVSAETPSRSIRNSQILPYLLDNHHDNSVVRVRCVPKFRQAGERQRRIIRDSLLTPTKKDNNAVTIDIEGNCRRVRIHVPNAVDSYGVEDGWLNREGSGWHWLLHNQP